MDITLDLLLRVCARGFKERAQSGEEGAREAALMCWAARIKLAEGLPLTRAQTARAVRCCVSARDTGQIDDDTLADFVACIMMLQL